MKVLERNHVTTKEQLYIKLLLFSLERLREFVLGQLDEELADRLSTSASCQENFHMLSFCFKSLDPDFFGENNINPELEDDYRQLIQKMKRITTSKQLYDFARNDCNDYILQLHSQLKKTS